MSSIAATNSTTKGTDATSAVLPQCWNMLGTPPCTTGPRYAANLGTAFLIFSLQAPKDLEKKARNIPDMSPEDSGIEPGIFRKFVRKIPEMGPEYSGSRSGIFPK